MAITMVACGDDEPNNSSSYTREFNMIYPQLANGHKLLSKIERTFANGTSTTVATATYDGDHLKRVKVVNDYGGNKNEETINFDYKNGAIICDKQISDPTYLFEVNNLGAITSFKLLPSYSSATSGTGLQYSYDNEVEIIQANGFFTEVTWNNGNIEQWKKTMLNEKDSVVYEYGTGAPLNKGGIDIPGNESIVFSTFVCAFMRNSGLFGATSAYLPTVIKKGIASQDDESSTTTIPELRRYNITYELDADGYVTSYTTNEVPSYTVRFYYR